MNRTWTAHGSWARPRSTPGPCGVKAPLDAKGPFGAAVDPEGDR